MAMSKPQREASPSADLRERGRTPQLLMATKTRNISANTGTGTFALCESPPFARKPPTHRGDDRQQHEDAEQFDDGRRVAGRIRHGVARADDLGDVVDRRAEEESRSSGRRSPARRRTADRRPSRAVASRLTVMATNAVSASRPLYSGSTEAVASAAEAPQTAVAPPASAP